MHKCLLAVKAFKTYLRARQTMLVRVMCPLLSKHCRILFNCVLKCAANYFSFLDIARYINSLGRCYIHGLHIAFLHGLHIAFLLCCCVDVCADYMTLYRTNIAVYVALCKFMHIH